jgi:hypothetical protein
MSAFCFVSEAKRYKKNSIFRLLMKNTVVIVRVLLPQSICIRFRGAKDQRTIMMTGIDMSLKIPSFEIFEFDVDTIKKNGEMK